MLGAIAGDVIGSVYEFKGLKTEVFPLFTQFNEFTDDSVLTVAVADAILQGRPYGPEILKYARAFPERGYGMRFIDWFMSASPRPYNSLGNGSAMRVSPVGWAFGDLETVLAEAQKSAEVTHNHPEGIKGAQAVAAAIFLARSGKSKSAIKQYLMETFGYNLYHTLEQIRPLHSFNETCPGSVPEALIAFFESSSFEDAVRKAISLGGDADTQACIAGSVAEAFYGPLPKEIAEEVKAHLDPRLLDVVETFMAKYVRP
jgi:ADP-ribosylglycohydrolase